MFYAFPIVAILINSKNITLILTIIITVCAIASSLSRIKNMSELLIVYYILSHPITFYFPWYIKMRQYIELLSDHSHYYDFDTEYM